MMRSNAHVSMEMFEKIVAALTAKGLDSTTVPAEFGEGGGKTRSLSKLTQKRAQELLAWLDGIPDDQPAESAAPESPADSPAEDADPTAPETPAAEDAEAPAQEPAETETPAAPEDEAEADDAESQGGNIRKAEDTIFIRRALTLSESEESFEELFKLAGRRSVMEKQLEGHKNAAKAAQKEIDAIEDTTFRIIQEIKEGEVEERIDALRVTHINAGMIYWYDRDTGELLRERAIEPGEQIALDLAGNAGEKAEAQAGETSAEDQEAGEPEAEEEPADPAENPEPETATEPETENVEAPNVA
jgi:hypothetical protein